MRHLLADIRGLVERARARSAHPGRPRLGRDRLLGLRAQAPRAARAPGDHRRAAALHLEPRPPREPEAARRGQLHDRTVEALAGARGDARRQRLLDDRRHHAADRRPRRAAVGRRARRSTTRPGASPAPCGAGSTTTGRRGWASRWRPAASPRSTRRRSARSGRGPDPGDLGRERRGAAPQADSGAERVGPASAGRDRPRRRSLGAVRATGRGQRTDPGVRGQPVLATGRSAIVDRAVGIEDRLGDGERLANRRDVVDPEDLGAVGVGEHAGGDRAAEALVDRRRR